MYQTPLPSHGDSTAPVESSLWDQLSAAMDTISSNFDLAFLDELSGAELLACIVFVAALIALATWHYENFVAWVDCKLQNGSLGWRRWRNRKKHLPNLEIDDSSSTVAARENQPEQDSGQSQVNSWFLSRRADSFDSNNKEWFLEGQNTQQESTNGWFLNRAQEGSSNGAETENAVATESEHGAHWQELKTRLFESNDRAAALEEKLALAEQRLAESEQRNGVATDQHASVSSRADELAMQLADARQEIKTQASLGEESKVALAEARAELDRLASIEKDTAVESEVWRLKWETLTTESAQAIQEANESNKILSDTLESESAARQREKMDLVMVRQNMEVMQARLDCQRDSIEKAHLQHDQTKADYEAAIEELKAGHAETLETTNSEFEALSHTLKTQAVHLQHALDEANADAEQSRSEAARVQGIVDALKAEHESSESVIQEFEVERTKATDALHKEEALRTELEGTVERLNQELRKQTEIVAGLEADLLASEESLALSHDVEQQKQLELQGKVEVLEGELRDRTASLSKLESDFLASEEALVNVRSEAEQRATALQSNVERLEQEFSDRTASLSKLEFDLLESEKALIAARAEKGERETEQQAEVERLEQELRVSTASLSKLESDLSTSEETLVNVRSEAEQHAAALQANVERLEQELSDRTASLSKLESELLESEEALVAARFDEGEREALLRTDVARLQQELNSRATVLAGLESDLLKSEEALVAARADEGKREAELRAELQADVERLEHELSVQTSTSAQFAVDLSKAEELLRSKAKVEQQQQEQLEAKAVELEDELNGRVLKCAELEAELSKSQQDLAAIQAKEGQEAAESQLELYRAEEEIKQLRSELNSVEKSDPQTAEAFAANESLIQKLQQELAAANVNRANYMKLAKKVVYYKTLSRERDSEIEKLTGQTARMSDLATEYFGNIKELRGELDSQTKLTSVLKQRLQEAERSLGKASNAEVNGASKNPSENEIDQLVQRKARRYVLKLKADFETRMKRKNKIIRKLRKEQVPETNGSRNGFEPSEGQSKNSQSDHGKVNLPR